MSEAERRHISGIEIRQTQGGRPRLVGYAAVFNKRSHDLGGFIEVIKPGAFRRSLQEHPDLRAFVDHDPAMIIGRVSAGTLKVAEDSQGLYVEIQPPDTQVGRDVIENIRVGNLDGMSFAFTLYDRDASQRWDTKQKPIVREILEARVFEASVVAMPAYPDTSVAVRAMEKHLSQRTIAMLNARLKAQAAGWR
jgi:uncharacterized protein